MKQCRNDALLRTGSTKRILTPLVTYDSVRELSKPGRLNTNDLDSSADYDEEGERDDRDFTVVRNYTYAEAPPTEYVDLPDLPAASDADMLDISITMTNTVRLTNDTTDFRFNYGSAVHSVPVSMSCMEGFVYNAALGSCTDEDECEKGLCSGTGQVCTNTDGSYECECIAGYRPVFYQTEDYAGTVTRDMQCVDINECREVTHECSHYCTNTPGSYECYCPDRYQLSKDGRTCTIKRKRNEPARLAVPRCPEGYQWEGGRCQDVDECVVQADECGESFSCINTRGGYLCVHTDCPPEYDQDEAGEFCLLNCTAATARRLCADGANRGQAISHLIVTLDRFNPAQSLALVSVPAAQRTIEFETRFSLRDRRFAHIFSLETMRKTSGAVRLYANRKLQRGTLYKLHVVAKSFYRRRLEYVHHFVVHVYWAD